MDFLPISPLRTETGALASLAEFLPEEVSKPVELGPSDNPFSEFRVVSDGMSVALASKLGIGSIFSGSASYNEIAMYYDAIAFTDKYQKQTVGDQLIYATRWGVGMRVALRVTSSKVDLNLSIASVAAAVQLQQARARYEILGPGLGIDGLAIVLAGMSALSDFTPETYFKLNNGVLANLQKYIIENKESLKPVPLAVALSRTIDLDPVLQARSVLWAMKRIADRMPLADAPKRAPATVDLQTVSLTYRAVVGDIPEIQPPSSDNRDEAQEWMRI